SELSKPCSLVAARIAPEKRCLYSFEHGSGKEHKDEKAEAFPHGCRVDRSGDRVRPQDGAGEHVVRSMRGRRGLHLLLPVRRFHSGLLRQIRLSVATFRCSTKGE